MQTPTSLGGRADRFVRDADAAFALEPPRVDAAATDAFALATVTNRHNPSGRLADRATLAALAAVATDHDGLLHVDEVYAPHTVDGGGGAFGGPTAAGIEGTVATGSITKFFGLGELRIGWLVGPESFVERARARDRNRPGVAAPRARLAARALHHREELSAEARDVLVDDSDALASFVAGRADLTGTVHEGSPFAFLSHADADGDEVSEAAFAEDVLVVPGRFFDDVEGFRVAACGPPAEVEAGLDALGSVLDGLG